MIKLTEQQRAAVAGLIKIFAEEGADWEPVIFVMCRVEGDSYTEPRLFHSPSFPRSVVPDYLRLVAQKLEKALRRRHGSPTPGGDTRPAG